MEKAKTIDEVNLQMLRAQAFHDGYTQAMKYVQDLLIKTGDEKRESDGIGIQTDSGNTGSPS